MRSIVIALLLWLSLTSVVGADVIFNDDPPRRRRPRYYPATEEPTTPAPAPDTEESWHPNIEQGPETPPEDAAFALAIIVGCFIVFGVRDARRSERRTA